MADGSTRGDRSEVVDDAVLLAARAVADPTRLAILRHIQASLAPVGVRDLADRLHVHHNAVRKHLTQLHAAGLVIEDIEHAGHTGRPRLCYRPDPDSADTLGGWNPYELLSTLLVEVAGGRQARTVGSDYGASVAQVSGADDPIELLLTTARRHGFEPHTESNGVETHVVLKRCPFESSVTGPRLVCDLHLGIAEGIVATTGHATVLGLDAASPRNGGCRLRVHVSPTAQEARS